MKSPQKPLVAVETSLDLWKLVEAEDEHIIKALKSVYRFHGGHARFKDHPLKQMDYLAMLRKPDVILPEINREYLRLKINPALPTSLVKNKAKPKPNLENAA